MALPRQLGMLSGPVRHSSQANPQPACPDLLLFRKVRIQVLCTEFYQVDAHLQLFHTTHLLTNSRHLGVCLAASSAVKASKAKQDKSGRAAHDAKQRRLLRAALSWQRGRAFFDLQGA